MNEREKSDSRIVPMKQPNKSNAKANEAEVVEGRGLTKRDLWSRIKPRKGGQRRESMESRGRCTGKTWKRMSGTCPRV